MCAPALVALVLLAGCNPTVEVAQPAPSESPSSPVATGTPTAPAEPCGADTYPESDPNRPRYEMTVRLDGSPVITGTTAVDFTPDLPTKRIVFRLWPNGPRQAREGAELTTGHVHSAGKTLPSRTADPTTLVVRPPGGVEAGKTISLSVDWRLTVPVGILDRLSLDDGSYRLGSFFPVLPWVPGKGWATDPPTTQLAEANTSPIADFDVRVKAPDGFRVLATGESVSRNRWRASEVRDFALAAGSFDVATGTADTPEPVKVIVGVERGINTPAQAWVDQVIADIEELAGRFGSYPWPTYSLAIMPALSSAGIEYPTMVFEGPDSLGQVTSHELGHMWFYSLVGSNPAQDPWLDEGLTSWAESSLQGTLGEFMSFDIPSPARGRLGRPMTFWDDVSEQTYYFGVYAQGVQTLGSLGPAEKVNCALRAYVSEHAFEIVEPGDLLHSLQTIFPDARSTLKEFGARF